VLCDDDDDDEEELVAETVLAVLLVLALALPLCVLDAVMVTGSSDCVTTEVSVSTTVVGALETATETTVLVEPETVMTDETRSVLVAMLVLTRVCVTVCVGYRVVERAPAAVTVVVAASPGAEAVTVTKPDDDDAAAGMVE
jgi:hypothetical protein